MNINKEQFEKYRRQEPRRFVPNKHSHNYGLKTKETEQYLGFFDAPFWDSIGPLFPEMLNLNYFGTGYEFKIIDINQYNIVKEWNYKYGNFVFLRDCLGISLALSLNRNSTELGDMTELGTLVNKAKDKPDDQALSQLSSYAEKAINGLPYYNQAAFLCAVPAPEAKSYDLPTKLAEHLSFSTVKTDITKGFAYKDHKSSIKALGLSQKWDALENACPAYEGIDISGKDVIIIDDKYQSGSTIHYIAMKLQEAGAQYIFGLSMVKTLRDTDNA